jgi:hypothetical protein
MSEGSSKAKKSAYFAKLIQLLEDYNKVLRLFLKGS